MNYPELLNLSRERLEDRRTYREIEHLDFFVLEDMVRSYSAFSGEKETLGDRHQEDYEYKAHDFLRERNIRVGDRALIALGAFDEDTGTKALPMFADPNKVANYHSAIFNDYRDMMSSFAPAGHPDSLEGQIFNRGDERVLAVRTRRILDYRRSEAVADISREFPHMTIVVSHISYLLHDIYRDGQMDYIEIDS
jgi:hypothetical protein